MLVSDIVLTWYPGDPPSTDDPLVLLGAANFTPEGSRLRRSVEQLTQSADFLRGTTGEVYARGNVRSSLEWTEVREVADPNEAQEIATTLAAGLPTDDGWLKLEFGDRSTTWKAARAVIRGFSDDHDDVEGLLSLRWTVECGALSVLAGGSPPTIYTPGEITTEESTPTDRFALLLEDAS